MALTEKQREALIKWLESMPWWKELPYGKFAAENEQLRKPLNNIYQHFENVGDAPIRYWIEEIEEALGGE